MAEWIPIRDYPNYEVSRDGRIRNRTTLQELRAQMHGPSGLMMVFLRKENRQHTCYVHRLVASAFLHPSEFGRAPVHLDGDRSNNHADNLEWRALSTAREITADREKTEPTHNWPVVNTRTGEVYDNPLDAARAVRGIEKYIELAAWNNSSYNGGTWAWY